MKTCLRNDRHGYTPPPPSLSARWGAGGWGVEPTVITKNLNWVILTKNLVINNILKGYAYCNVTKYDFRFSKILIFRLNFPSADGSMESSML